MSTPFVGQVLMFGGNFAIQGWATCGGQLMAISENEVLFSLIGTTYGGDGLTTFGLPDMRGRVLVSQGNLAGGGTYIMGQRGGTEDVTLITQQLPAHSHAPACNSANGNSADPANNFWAGQSALIQYTNPPDAGAGMKANAINNSTGNQSHSNIMPYTVVNYLIALYGVYPSRN